MPEQHLDDAKLDATSRRCVAKAVPQAMGRDGLAEPHLRRATRQASCKAAMLT
jgi:hypothetical protein